MGMRCSLMLFLGEEGDLGEMISLASSDKSDMMIMMKVIGFNWD